MIAELCSRKRDQEFIGFATLFSYASSAQRVAGTVGECSAEAKFATFCRLFGMSALTSALTATFHLWLHSDGQAVDVGERVEVDTRGRG